MFVILQEGDGIREEYLHSSRRKTDYQNRSCRFTGDRRNIRTVPEKQQNRRDIRTIEEANAVTEWGL